MKPPRFPFPRSGFAALLLSLGLTGAAAAQELAVEYGFESMPAYIPNWGAGYHNHYKSAASWKKPFTVALDKENPHSGESCLRITLRPEADGTVRVHSPGIPLAATTESRTVRVHAFVRTSEETGGPAFLGLLERGEGGKPIGFAGHKERLEAIGGSREWKEIVLEGKLDAGTRTLILMVTADPQPAEASLWLDDISIEIVPGA